jgi:hypothetical protein
MVSSICRRIGDKMCHVCFQDEGEEGAADVLSRCIECGISVHPPVRTAAQAWRLCSCVEHIWIHAKGLGFMLVL